MITLFINEISESLKKNKPWQDLLQQYCSTSGTPLNLSGPKGAFLAAILADLFKYTKDSLLIVTPTERDAEELEADLSLFSSNIILFPWWGTMLYKGVSAQASIFGSRVRTLIEISETKSIVIASQKAALSFLPPKEYLLSNKITLKKGDEFDPVHLEEILQEFGYSRVPRVTVHGEFALRGEVLDVFMPGMDDAVRIVFDFDEIEEIKAFDPINQSSTSLSEEITFYPVKEVLWTDERIAVLEKRLGEISTDKIDSIDFNSVLETLKTSREIRGEELFFPLSFEKPSTLIDYISEKSALFLSQKERLESSYEVLHKEYHELYIEALRMRFSVPAPEYILSDQRVFTKPKQINLHSLKQDKHRDEVLYEMECDPGRSFFGNISYLKEELMLYKKDNFKCFIFAESDSQADRITYMLNGFDIEVIPESISSGFSLPLNKIVVIQENEIFGRRKRVPSTVKRIKSAAIDSFIELNPGDLVVHVNYGIGRFRGIERIKAAGNERDYISIEYAGEDSIFVPIEQVNLVQRYIGNEGRSARLDKIGGKTWDTKKNKVRKSVEDLADMLVKLYARRQNAKGFAFAVDNDFQVAFEASFPYQETEDQLTSIDEVKKDMEAPRPMDRLICGDVGYGKTEVAMRAAFKAVMGGKQVALLCPTTILAEQHYENFCDRFKRFPIEVGHLSRFVTKKDQKKVLESITDGSCDIVIGTHRILSKDLKFKNLGLMIIDEEQRFGVKDKEKLKNIKASIDSLAMSATPIPRTLHMSLLKIRDMSVLKTAPYNRQPIETFIQAYDPDIIASAIRREVERGGQVFFLHNRVESLDSVQLYLQQLIPEVFIESAHGKMTGKELEDVMHRFVHGAFQVLVATTIIENGIDIPNVNTIIIDRADMYGISQLYQLRGRVGRSGKLAYAYMFYPEQKTLSELAMKRLQAISDFTELGSGFKIAMKDMEVRGAGNLLGREQSGEIVSVGFDMYLRLLEEAVAERTDDDKKEEAPEVYLELDYTGFIPDLYIDDPTEKMEVYKKIASVISDDDLDKVHSELHDRFGPLPDEVQSLLSLAEIRIICRKLWISSMKERGGVVAVEFGKIAKLSIDKVMRMTGKSGGLVKFNPTSQAGLLIQTGKIGLKEKSEFLREKLSNLI
ncbi:MAG: transcription-repair coupling factor [Spirochaetaceae bacterium]|jgi:transcription-repair coupling factor (superfamily II helicase)|nr:transcription-repair coupling factor [Spirochaetaceae bacterium]